MTALSDHLLAAAVDAGEVPAEVADWVDAGARPDPDVVDGHDVDTAYQRAKRWEIDSVSAATWAMRKLAAAKDAEAAVYADYERERKRLDRWRESSLRAPLNTAAYMTDRLTRWALAERERTGQATIRTPAGNVETRMPSAPWKVQEDDADALFRWAESTHPEWLRQSLQPMGVIRKAVQVVEHEDGPSVIDVNGELVPGLMVEPTRPTVTVRPAATE